MESGVPFHIHLLATIKEIYLTGHRKFIWPKGLRHSERGRSKTCLTCFYLFFGQRYFRHYKSTGQIQTSFLKCLRHFKAVGSKTWINSSNVLMSEINLCPDKDLETLAIKTEATFQVKCIFTYFAAS